MKVLLSRYLQTLNSISAENNSTIVFPVPIDIISQLVTQGSESSAVYNSGAGVGRDDDTKKKTTLINISEN